MQHLGRQSRTEDYQQDQQDIAERVRNGPGDAVSSDRQLRAVAPESEARART